MQTAQLLHERSGLFTEPMLRRVSTDLAAFQKEIRPGTAAHASSTIRRLATRPDQSAGRTARSIIKRLTADMRAFARRKRLDRVVVINVASTEPIFPLRTVHNSWPSLDKALTSAKLVLPPSSLYAIAAIEAGMPYINFTPSLGANVPAIIELAEKRGVPIMGSDGKTGETLLKSVLAPMFKDRNLRVLSWTGANILGNRDGQVLSSAANKASKLHAKDRALHSILGYRTQTHISIDCVDSLDDWKTAWDHVHFEGFLGTRMTLQFTWQGCDSILAAPLVIDLARFADLHARLGGAGPMAHLACFFKDPMGCTDHRFSQQIQLLHYYAAHVKKSRA